MGIKADHLTLVYNSGLAYETKAVDDVSFMIDDGSFVSIIGHTGSGKSTLVQQINGILKPTSGKIYIDGVDITGKDIKKGRKKKGSSGLSLTDIRKKVGLVFQYPEYQLFDETVGKDVGFGPRNLGLDEAESERRVREAMELVGMDYGEFAERSPFDLSGGEKRRIAIAGVIAMEPKILILDEPTAGLDPKAHSDVLEMVVGIHRRRGGIIMLVSHNMDDVASLSDRVLVMDEGRLVKDGTPAEVFSDAGYLGSIGLGLPPAARMAGLLSERGFAMAPDTLTIDMLADRVAAGLAARRRAGPGGGSA